jgi:hypothetical protein
VLDAGDTKCVERYSDCRYVSTNVYRYVSKAGDKRVSRGNGDDSKFILRQATMRNSVNSGLNIGELVISIRKIISKYFLYWLKVASRLIEFKLHL